jgi:prevent-host-death family protein
MYMKVLPMSEARRRLPELVRRVVGGQPPIVIGRRGRAEALLSRAPVEAPVRRSLVGLVEVIASDDELEAAHAQLRGDIDRGLAETERLLTAPRRRAPRARR